MKIFIIIHGETTEKNTMNNEEELTALGGIDDVVKTKATKKQRKQTKKDEENGTIENVEGTDLAADGLQGRESVLQTELTVLPGTGSAAGFPASEQAGEEVKEEISKEIAKEEKIVSQSPIQLKHRAKLAELSRWYRGRPIPR